ncbi:MAG: ABC transporter permease [Phocaeicola sp.]
MLRFLLEKEFKQLLRNSFIPRIIVLMPTIMLLIMPWAANQEIKELKLSIVDNDHSSYSERFTQKVTASGYFRLTDISSSNEQALESVEASRSDAILEIQPNFERELIHTGVAHVMISVNSINGPKGGLGSSYLAAIVQDFSNEIRAEQGFNHAATYAIAPRYWYNPHLDYKIYIVPALMVMLLTLLTGFLPALNMVSEKEVGTIEQLNVTPIKKGTFILAKLIPYWLVGYIVLTIGLLIAAFVYNLYPSGSLATIYLFATVYILAISGFGLVISNYSNTMQEAQFMAAFFLVILIMLSGLFFPINSMPEGFKIATLFNPLRHFMEVMRAVYLKGSAFYNLLPQFIALCGFALFFNLWAVLSYQKSN